MGGCNQGSGMVFEFERQAMNGDPIPHGLSQVDQLLYLQLRSLYYQYRAGWLTRDRGTEDKKRLIAEYTKRLDTQKFIDDLTEWHVRLRKRIEAAHAEYRKNPTPENAEKLSKAIDGISRDVV